MKKLKLVILSWAIFAQVISGCESTEETPRGEYATGVIIVNEGNFTEANGSLGFYNESNSEVIQDIFNNANSVSHGGIIQSVYFYNDMAFIIDQLGSRIEVVEAETFKSIAVIDAGLSTPRYMVVSDGKGYVSNWGNFDADDDVLDSYVAVIDLEDFVVTKSIKTGNGSEGLLVFGENVYVANSYSNTIEEIDPAEDAIVSSLSVATGPIGFAEDINAKVWVLSNSYLSGSALSQLDLSTEKVLKTFTVSPSAKSLNINGGGDQLYYLSTPYGADSEVKMVSIDAEKDATEALIKSANLYGLGIDPITNLIYLGNHNGFQGNGTLLRYEGSVLKDNFAAGVAPNGFVFRN
jgi:DNA-binding beta-propeller fold protein YncE